MKRIFFILISGFFLTLQMTAQVIEKDTCRWEVTDNSTFYLEGNVGIGTSTPESALDIVGDETEWPGRVMFSINNTSISNKSLAYMRAKAGSSGNHTILGHISETYAANDSPEDLQDYGILSSSGNGLIVGATKNDKTAGVIKFCSGQSKGTTFDERMRINSNGFVGIKEKSPVVELDINGGIRIGNSDTTTPGVIRWTGNDFEGYNGTNWISFTRDLTLNPLWEESGDDIYFNNGRIGIGTNSPQQKLHIKDENAQFYIGHQPAYDGPFINLIGEVAGQTPMIAMGLAQADYNKFGSVLAKNNWGYIYGNNYNEGIAILPDMQYAPIGLYIERTGNVGVGTDSPEAKLQVSDGDIYISDIDKGIIMKSPDGQCWRGTLDNTGSLNFEMVDCPGEMVDSLGDKSLPTAIETQGQIQNNQVSIYPNPANGLISVKLADDLNSKVDYAVYSISGQLITNGKIRSQLHTLDISSLANGEYMMNIIDKDGNMLTSKPFIKQ